MIHAYERNTWLSRLLCLMTAFMLLLPALNTQASAAYTSKYYYTTIDKVMFRPQVDTSNYHDRLPANWPVEKVGEKTADGDVWFEVKSNTPTQPNREFTGFIQSNFLRMMTQAEETAFLAGSSAPDGTTPPVIIPPGGENQLSNQAIVIAPNTKLLQTPDGALIAAFLPDTRMTVLDTPGDTINGWYKVLINNYTGYMQGKNLRVLTLGEANVQTTAEPTQQAGYVKLTKHNVNLRKTPGGESQTQVPINTVLPFYGPPTSRAGYQWVYVLYNGTYGYVRSDCYTFTDAAGNPVAQPTAAPTAAPQPGVTPPPISGSGYVRITKGLVNLRKTPGGDSLLQMDRGLVLPYTGQPTLLGGYRWIYVEHTSGTKGYVRSDCYEFVDNSGGLVPTPTPQPDIVVGNIITTIGGLNVRSAPSLAASVLTQLPKSGVVFPYKGFVTSGGTSWYQIVYQGQNAYIVSTFAKLTDTTIPATPTPGPTATINPEDLSSTAVTTMDRVLVRESGNSSARTLTLLYKKGSVAKLTGTVNTSGNYLWRQVNAGGVTGYIRADLLRILSKTEEQALENSGNPDLPVEATYRTLRRGDSGADVTRLQTELARLNFLSPQAVTGVYGNETISAVKQFQLATALFVDGIAGSSTQHKLYGTVPEGSNDPGGTANPDMYPVEMAPWSVVDTVWKRGITAVLTDVKSGLSFRARRWAGRTHADVEPLTAADTVVMCKIYGVKDAQEIVSKNLYQRKPFWVTVAGNTFAASVYAVPHNYPDGDTIPNNDFNGQFCVHFLGSTTHNNPNTVDPDHKKAIEDAYNAAPTKK